MDEIEAVRRPQTKGGGGRPATHQPGDTIEFDHAGDTDDVAQRWDEMISDLYRQGLTVDETVVEEFGDLQRFKLVSVADGYDKDAEGWV